ncbi:uncharacterized protein LOC119726510 [Patiria miniata]|uniref:Ig-like domain-containing protein n=1 Tax=Patiria miniata TaxID=46514 RepID=A0A913ZR68_PATMI|nr:uncharacterized protein LOC119726510 [Patiria miniata]XP_038054162.1 uncharacterized protein LOC119726510 [Patiria miniata]
MKIIDLTALWIILMVGGFILANDIEDGTIFLERGNPGILSCPPVASGQIPLDQIEVMYWYSPVLRDENILISYFLGNVAPQNGIPEGQYDINGNFSLVIENVTDSDEGTYYCRVKPRLRALVDGHVAMRVKVAPQKPFPDVTQCIQRVSESECEVEWSNDIKKTNLTCIVRDTKPAVALRWLLEYSDGGTQLISDRFTVQLSEFSVNTFTTSASIPIVASNVDKYMYRCQAYGEALGARNGSHVTVTAFYTLQTSHSTSLQSNTAVTVMPRLDFTTEVHDAPEGSQNDMIGPTDTPDGYRYAFIATAVALCLSLAAIVGLVIAVCKISRRKPEQNEKVEVQ